MTSPTLSYHLESKAVPQATGRRYELDWLRVMIVLGLIPFHVVGLFTATIDTYFVGGQTNPLIAIIGNFLGLWPMSLLFLIAGASTWFALGAHSPRHYARERIVRLFVPFLFATLVLIPIQVYAVVHAYPQLLQLHLVPTPGLNAQESFLQFYPAYLAAYGFFLSHFSSLLEAVFWGHLWFIPRLLLYALATLPVLLWLRSASGKHYTSRLADMFVLPGSTLLLGLAIALPRILSVTLYRLGGPSARAIGWDVYNLWAQLAVFLIFFLIGYLIYATPRLLQAVVRDGATALLLGVAIFLLLQTPLVNAPALRLPLNGAAIICLRAMNEWCWVIGVLSIGLRFLTFHNSTLRYLNEAAYPLYVLHLPILILVGLPLVAHNTPTPVALAIIIVTTLVLTFGLYEYVIKRVTLLRLLFGLKSLPR